MSLVAGGVAPYWPQLGSVLWWAAFALMLAFQVWALVRWLAGGIELAQLNAGWLIILVGGIVLPGPGLALGHVEASRFIFGVSAIGAALLMPLLLYRALAAPPLPEVLRPSWFILLVPPSLIYAHGVHFFPELLFLENLLFFGLLLFAGLLVYARGFLRWRFGVPWWAFTFPLDAFGYAAARYAQEYSSQAWRVVAAVAILLAAAFILLCLAKTALQARRGRPA
jgi:tellurite resistance protein